jgi:sec-independent protein translocase protein TatA
MSPLYGFFEGALSPTHLIILLVIGMLFFGKRLPEIGHSLGKAIQEFKRGFQGLEEEEAGTVTAPARQEPVALEPPRPPQRVVTSVPKFEDSPNSLTPPQA